MAKTIYRVEGPGLPGQPPFPGAADYFTIKSSDAADTWGFFIRGLGPGRVWQEEIVTLQGKTNVPSAYEWYRVNRLYVLGADIDDKSTGQVTAKFGAQTVAKIDPDSVCGWFPIFSSHSGNSPLRLGAVSGVATIKHMDLSGVVTEVNVGDVMGEGDWWAEGAEFVIFDLEKV